MRISPLPNSARNIYESMHKRSAVKRSRRAQTVLGDRHDLVCEILLQVTSAACGTRPAEFFNGWARKLICDGSEKRSSENLIRSREQRTHLNSRGKSVRSTSLQHKEPSCGIKQQKFIPSDRMKPHIAQHRRPAIRAAYPIESIGAQHR